MLANSDRGFGVVAIVLHWLIAAVFLTQIAYGFLMTRAFGLATMFTLVQWHKSFGLAALGLGVIRIAWSAVGRRPAPVRTLGPAERTASRIVQGLLMAATLIVPLAGWALASTSPLNIPTFAFDLVVVPDLPFERSDAAEAFWRSAHAWLAYSAGVLALGHAGAALRHHWLIGDTVLTRMIRVPTVREAARD